MKNKIFAALTCMMMVVVTPLSSYAGEWKEDAGGWRWKYDDGSYASDCWEWIDGNQDGVCECYYFGKDSYMAKDISIQGGGYLNHNGAWVLDGQVQTVSAAMLESETEWMAGSLDIENIRRKVVNCINQERRSQGVPALSVHDELTRNADVRARELAIREQHVRPDGRSFSSAITVNYTAAGENFAIAYIPYQETEDEVVEYLTDGWMNSGIHLKNLLKTEWKETGIGVYIEGNQIYIVQLFI